MREIDGKKVAFLTSEDYFASLDTPSMYRTAQKTGADMVLLLSPGVTSDDVSDDDLRTLLNPPTSILYKGPLFGYSGGRE